ncbi:restriction endonuclease subunit S [Tenacibaculum finnmarkense]|uniref:restriction endonuclease subunit S n=1 Tax=Tenacibaculum finnmarkense TaxID=2781243 RepID=UPI001EFBCC40|nr:restriction endonuclease subunit S [Tenacibaculum finnmarkense]MCG8748587.1 restriction endonuclease subunit S [Tenacibaculum finnmarkense]MCG8753515.1 restriction endonuclease subunit S [Tenacibaculum finnmarkense]MCG8782242.1 restriction endonuclease subunit S [Tenacibaculum finnmarkense]
MMEEWKEFKLSELATFRRGSFPQPYGLDKWYDDKNGHPFIQVFDVAGNMKLKDKTKKLISDLATEQSVFIPKGTLILTIQGTIGRVAITHYDAYIDRTLLIFQDYLKPTDRRFFMYVIHRLFEIEKEKAHGSTIKTITKEQLSNFKIPLPPLKEQQKIAEILSTVDAKISIIDAQISETQNLKKGLMQSLLSKGIGHTEFKKSALGEIPKSWEVVKLDKIAKISRGKFQHRPRNAPEFYGGKYPYVQTGDIGKSNGKIIKYSQTLNELGLSVSKLFPKGTIVITIAANIGDTAIAQFEIAFPDSLIGINVKEEVNNIFLRYFLVTQKNNLNKLSTVSAQKNINLETLKPYKIPLPPIKEQEKIASILNSVDEKLGVLSEKKSYYQNLKKGLMQQLLTGLVRVLV